MPYFRFGKGAKIMVILPGLSVKNTTAFARDIAAAYKGFADEYTVYVFDRRSALPPVYTIGYMALDTAAALEVLGLKDTYMFGASQGGMMALIIAAEHPELVKKAVLGSAADRLDGEHYRLFERWIKLARSGDARGLYLSFAESVYPQSFYKKYREAFIAAAAAVTEEELERFSILAAAAKDFDASALLPRIKSPVLVLGAADDRVLGAEGSERIAAALKCEIYIYSGFGHAAYDTAPDYKARILRFFEKE
ncbi:alpha/beta hydrolase [bacterium]|nr:alpha/beta hydrolase [bacterium]